MPRKPRVEYSGAFYHVITRGNQRQNLFHDDKDREFYLDRLEQYRKRYGFTIYAYVLMSNHVHLLIETGKTPLSKIMQGLQFSYTRYFNRRYRKIGHLFQGRYRAIICDREEYLLELVRYIHLNPARMKRPSAVGEHRWSSHRAYLGAASIVEVDTESVLERFSRRVRRAREGYLRFIKEGEGQGHDERYYATVDQRFLGDDRFVKEIGKKVGEDREVEPKMRRVKFSALLNVIAEQHGAEAKTLVQAGRQRQWVKTRSMLVYMAREFGGMTVKELGKRLNRDPSIISRLYSAYTGSRDSVAESRLLRKIGQ
jgi:putative transposase